MRLPRSYALLLDFFLDKRDVTKGGVEGFTTPFSFSYKELEDATGITQDEIPEMLEVLRMERIKIETDSEPLIENISIQDGKVTIENCTTAKLNKYRKTLVEASGIDMLGIDKDSRTITYLNHSYKFSKGNRWRLLWCLYLAHPFPVTYERIFKKFYTEKSKNSLYAKSNKKEVQDAVSGIDRDMTKKGFGATLIENVPRHGYKLKSVFY